MKSSSNIISGTDGTKQLVTYSKTQQKIVRQLVRSDDEYLSVSKLERRISPCIDNYVVTPIMLYIYLDFPLFSTWDQ